MVNVDGFLKDGDSVRWGPYEGRVIHTAGHTPGSVCIYMPGIPPAEKGAEPGRLFAGDTLFAGSIGRTDLWGGSFEEIMRSLQTKLMALPDETLVYPGHGPSTTIAKERKTNPFLRS
jgi:glyoxylase-like metal-dependent hydrolase (beta-lactamase superfamily II)